MAQAGITRRHFGNLPTGEAVDLYTLVNAQGACAQITNYGGIVVSLRIPDGAGALDEVVLGYGDLSGYVANQPYFGALVGRYANRIGNAQFVVAGVEYRLRANDGRHHLHGGLRGFDKALWRAASGLGPNGPLLELRYVSAAGEEGYPGELEVAVTYTLTEDTGLRIDYQAHSDRDTVVNLSHHSYFNLRDAGASSILGHQLQINADRYTPVDATLIPTGAIAAVHGTPLDFKRPQPIGARIDQSHEQLLAAGGYDHNFVLNAKRGELVLAARVSEPHSGRSMEVYTTQPGLQFYSGNFLDGSVVGRAGTVYGRRHGFCLEAQHFPDSPNKPHFPSTQLKPGESYRHTTLYKFAASK
jgi:aldose 1-epimerase